MLNNHVVSFQRKILLCLCQLLYPWPLTLSLSKYNENQRGGQTITAGGVQLGI